MLVLNCIVGMEIYSEIFQVNLIKCTKKLCEFETVEFNVINMVVVVVSLYLLSLQWI